MLSPSRYLESHAKSGHRHSREVLARGVHGIGRQLHSITSSFQGIAPIEFGGEDDEDVAVFIADYKSKLRVQ